MGATDDSNGDGCATKTILTALHHTGHEAHLENDGYNTITIRIGGIDYDITIRRRYADIETNIDYELWADDGHPCNRLGRIYPTAPRYASRMPCPACDRQLGDEPVQAVLIGPEPEDRDKHAAGEPYTAKWLLAHLICVQGRAAVP